jgi:hypothetical protein
MTGDYALAAAGAGDDPAESVIQACRQAVKLLREVLDYHDIDQIAELRSQAEAVRAYTIAKQLGQDALLAAAEIVRRAERGIGLAIRLGQQNGTIRRQGQGGGQPPRSGRPRTDSARSSPEDFASRSELRGNGGGIYQMTDGVSDEAFDKAIAEAKTEGNLSRANVIRKARQLAAGTEPAPEAGVSTAGPARGPQEDPARRQVAAILGIGEDEIRDAAREHGITPDGGTPAGRGGRNSQRPGGLGCRRRVRPAS